MGTSSCHFTKMDNTGEWSLGADPEFRMCRQAWSSEKKSGLESLSDNLPLGEN